MDDLGTTLLQLARAAIAAQFGQAAPDIADQPELHQAGATFVTPGCAACLGTHEGMLASGETCITSTNRNFPGRMGHTQGQIFLGSPAAVAAAALEGKIVDPSDYI